MQDRPTAAELLDAAREFLETEVMPALTGRKQFHVRVTVNVLRILGREWELEEDAVRDEHARLSALLGASAPAPSSFKDTRSAVHDMNRDLSAKIRSGELDDRFADVLAALMPTVEDKLRIANPRWLEE